MSLEGFSKRGMELGNNPEGLSETKSDLRQQYLSAIKRLALEKMKNDILFEGKVGATIRNLSSMGLNITRESILKDIETEITRQRSDLSWDEYATQKAEEINNRLGAMNASLNIPTSFEELPKKEVEIDVIDETKSQIESLKNNLSGLFESTPTQAQKPINTSGTIPREPTIQSTQEHGVLTNNFPQASVQSVQQTPVHTEQEKQEIREQLQQDQEEIKQKLEWPKQQPNEPTMTFTSDLANLSDDVKQRIVQQMESRGEVIISGINNIYQEGNYIVVDAKDNQGRFTGAEFTLEDFTKLVNQPPTKTKVEEFSQTAQVQQQQPIGSINNEIQQSVQEQQKQMKDQVIDQIMGAMNKSGEFSFGDISMSERMSIMQNVQNKLNAKSMDELQMLLSTYQEQNVQEETMSSGMHR